MKSSVVQDRPQAGGYNIYEIALPYLDSTKSVMLAVGWPGKVAAGIRIRTTLPDI
jgi:hypothetical protein